MIFKTLTKDQRFISYIIISVACGEFFFFDFLGFTVRCVDVVEFFMIIQIFRKSFLSTKIKVLFKPIQLFLLFCFFFTILIFLPVFGVLKYHFSPVLLSSSVRFIALSVLFFLFFQLKISLHEASKEFGMALIFVVLINFFYAILQQMEFLQLIPWETLPHHYVSLWADEAKFSDWGRATGLFLNPNKLGWLGVSSYCVFFIGYVLGQKSYRFLVVTSASLTLLSNSRSSIFIIIALTALVLLFLAWKALLFQKIQKKVAIRVFEFFLIISTATYIIIQFGEKFFKIERIMRFVRVVSEGTHVDTSLSGRIESGWRNGLNAMQLYPWGTGVDPVFCVGVIDSGWLSYWAQGGVLLCLVFATYLISLGGYGLMRYIKINDRYGFSLFLMSIAIIVGSIVMSPFHHLVVFIIFHLLFYLVIINKNVY